MGHITNKRKQKLYASARSIDPVQDDLVQDEPVQDDLVQDEPVQDELTERSRRKKK